jgi:formylglycine-generating enzyme required for sulfatase activity
VPGGTFYRSYDGVTTTPYDYTSQAYPATVSSFRLDKYPITLGRFRQFVAAWNAGWRPAAGSGKHGHLNGGLGLADSGGAGMYEAGWSAALEGSIATDDGNWTANLLCGAAATWTASAAGTERLPINCMLWQEAVAFCIWDGGFLPSEAEWNYAAAGGSEQRVYPWSSPPTSTAIDCSHSNYMPCGGVVNDVGHESPTGDGRWGHVDLAGNLLDLVLDYEANYANPCVDCAFKPWIGGDAMRGGYFGADASTAVASARSSGGGRIKIAGARCARIP